MKASRVKARLAAEPCHEGKVAAVEAATVEDREAQVAGADRAVQVAVGGLEAVANKIAYGL